MVKTWHTWPSATQMGCGQLEMDVDKHPWMMDPILPSFMLNTSIVWFRVSVNHLAKHFLGSRFMLGEGIRMFILMMFSCYSMDPSDLAY